MEKNYTEFNSHCIDRWVAGGWEWGVPISREAFERARAGEWEVFLTPTRPVPRDWFCPMKGAKILGLASGGGQQMPVFLRPWGGMHRSGLFPGPAGNGADGGPKGGLRHYGGPGGYDPPPSLPGGKL